MLAVEVLVLRAALPELVKELLDEPMTFELLPSVKMALKWR
jgi:hypothetical protein